MTSPRIAHSFFCTYNPLSRSFSQLAAALLSCRSRAPGGIQQVDCTHLFLFTHMPIDFVYWLLPMSLGITPGVSLSAVPAYLCLPGLPILWLSVTLYSVAPPCSVFLWFRCPLLPLCCVLDVQATLHFFTFSVRCVTANDCRMR